MANKTSSDGEEEETVNHEQQVSETDNKSESDDVILSPSSPNDVIQSLMMAVYDGDQKQVEQLIDDGIDVNGTSNGFTALEVAISLGKVEIADKLITAGANIHHMNAKGNSPIVEAAKYGSIEMMELLHENGASINPSTQQYYDNILNTACLRGHAALVEYILQTFDCESEIIKSLSAAVMKNHMEVMEVFIQHGVDLSDIGCTSDNPLITAIYWGNVDMARYLIQHGCDQNGFYSNITPLMMATWENDVQMVKCFLEEGCNVNGRSEAENTTALQLASSKGYLKIAQVLIEGGADIELGSEKPILKSAYYGHHHLLQLLIEKGADVDSCDNIGHTSLHMACTKGNKQIIEMLLLYGANINCIDQNGSTPLMFAVKHHKQSIIKFLLSKGADINMRSSNPPDESALTISMENNDPKMTDLLLQNGADMTVTVEGHNLLMGAAFNGDTEILEVLLQFIDSHKAKTSPPGNNKQNKDETDEPIFVTDEDVEPPSDDIVVVDRTKYLDINAQSPGTKDTALSLACKKGHTDVVKLLIEYGADVNCFNVKHRTPVMLASMIGYGEILKLLLQAKACPHASDSVNMDTALTFACASKHTEIVKILLECDGMDLNHYNHDQHSPLFFSIKHNLIDMAKILISYGATVHQPVDTDSVRVTSKIIHAISGKGGANSKQILDRCCKERSWLIKSRTALIIHASKKGNVEMVGLLIDNDANVNQKSRSGSTSLMYAASEGHTEVVKLLLDKGADVNAKTTTNETALMYAANKGQLKSCQLLLEHEADVNWHNKKGYSPFWMSCHSGNINIMNLLIKYGVNINEESGKGVTPLMAAFTNGHTKILKRLVKVVQQIPSARDSLLATLTADKKLKDQILDCYQYIEEERRQREEISRKNASKLLKELGIEEDEINTPKNKKDTKRVKKSLKKKKKNTKKSQASTSKHVNIPVEFNNESTEEEDEDFQPGCSSYNNFDTSLLSTYLDEEDLSDDDDEPYTLVTNKSKPIKCSRKTSLNDSSDFSSISPSVYHESPSHMLTDSFLIHYQRKFPPRLTKLYGDRKIYFNYDKPIKRLIGTKPIKVYTSDTRMEFSLPTYTIPHLVGQQGFRIISIMKKTQSKIDIDRCVGKEDQIITIRGSRDAQNLAFRFIKDFIERIAVFLKDRHLRAPSRGESSSEDDDEPPRMMYSDLVPPPPNMVKTDDVIADDVATTDEQSPFHDLMEELMNDFEASNAEVDQYSKNIEVPSGRYSNKTDYGVRNFPHETFNFRPEADSIEAWFEKRKLTRTSTSASSSKGVVRMKPFSTKDESLDVKQAQHDLLVEHLRSNPIPPPTSQEIEHFHDHSGQQTQVSTIKKEENHNLNEIQFPDLEENDFQ